MLRGVVLTAAPRRVNSSSPNVFGMEDTEVKREADSDFSRRRPSFLM
jgi:hypothetical protein